MSSEKNIIGTKSVKLTERDFPDDIELPELSEGVRKAIRDSKVKSLQAFLDDKNPTTVRRNILKYWGIESEV